jgi:hypothetical protein
MSRVPRSWAAKSDAQKLAELDGAIKAGRADLRTAKAWGDGSVSMRQSVLRVLLSAATRERHTMVGHSCPGEQS